MKANIPVLRTICGNPKCRHHTEDPVIEINFFTSEIVYLCSKCGVESKISLRAESPPLPRIRTRR